MLIECIRTRDYIEEHKSSLSSLQSITSKLNKLSFELKDIDISLTENKSESKEVNLNENIELQLLKDQMNTISKEYSSYDIGNRLILEQSLNYNTSIDKYDFIYYKPIARHDSGGFTNIIIITALNDTLYFHDIYMNRIFDIKLNYSIGDVITFKQIDETDFYILNKNRTIISKYTLTSQKYENKLKNNSIKNITIRTFKESKYNENNDNRIYDLSYNYLASLQKIYFDIVLKEQFSLFNYTNSSDININDTIDVITPVLTKGSKSINIITYNRHLYKIKAINFDIINHLILPNDISNHQAYNSLPIVFMNFYSFISLDNNIIIHSFNKEIAVECKIVSMRPFTINNYYFDSVYHILFVIGDEGNLYYSFPNIFGHHRTKCDIHFLFKINLKFKEKYQINMLRKDLLISNEYNQYVVINFEEVEWNDSQSFKNFKINQVNLQKNEGHLLSQSKLIRTSMEHYLLIRSKDNEVLLYHIPNINGKIIGNEEIGFNFKVPVIFIALVVIFFVNYYKKKQGNNQSSEAFRGEIMKELKKYEGGGGGGPIKQRKDKGFKRD